MSWQNIDLFALEETWFSEELCKVILPLFEQGDKWVAKWEEERRELLRKWVLEAKDDEAELQTVHALADLEELHILQRSQVLGAAALHYLFSTLKTRLKELGRYFDRTHPRALGGYAGKSELDRICKEYLERFAIDFKKSSLFSGVEELALARNAGIHLSVETMTEYSEKVKLPRFCKDAQFHVQRESFLEVLSQTEDFFRWVVESLIPIRKAASGARDAV